MVIGLDYIFVKILTMTTSIAAATTTDQRLYTIAAKRFLKVTT